MTDIRTEASFTIAASPAAAWKALSEVRARADAPDEWWLPGFESRGAEVSVEPERQLTVRKLEQPCADTLIAITFEHRGTGTLVRVVQSGFDEAFVAAAGEGFWIHADHIAADLHLFLEAGAAGGRAWQPWTPLGVRVATEPFGLVVAGVHAGSWAERVGLQDDDVLLTVAGAPLYTVGELGVVERIVRPGDDVVATWARGRESHEAMATA